MFTIWFTKKKNEQLQTIIIGNKDLYIYKYIILSNIFNEL